MLRRPRLLAALALLAGLALPASASADLGNGAQVIDTPFTCQEYPIGTVCIAERAVMRWTLTPSGNYIVGNTWEIQTTYSTPSCERSESRRGNNQYMLTSGELQQSVFNQRGEFSYQCVDEPRSASCTYRTQDVWANGEVRHEITDMNCESAEEPAAASA